MLPQPMALFIALPIVALTLLVSIFWRQAVLEDEQHGRRSRFSASFRRHALKREPMTVWLVAAALSVLFISAGLSKWIPPQDTVLDQFDAWGYPAWLSYGVGALEFAAALVLTFRWSTFWSALALGAVMVGAIATHIVSGDIVGAFFPAVVLYALSWVGYMRRPPAWGGDFGYEPIWRSEIQAG